MTLFLRDLKLFGRTVPASARVIEGDVLDTATLKDALIGQDVVYANLAGDVAAQAANTVTAMQQVGIKKLIFCASLGIYDEVPGKFGEWNRREIGAFLPS
jgi:uncharacterized protein YbjT (DUF2867 family)